MVGLSFKLHHGETSTKKGQRPTIEDGLKQSAYGNLHAFNNIK